MKYKQSGTLLLVCTLSFLLGTSALFITLVLYPRDSKQELTASQYLALYRLAEKHPTASAYLVARIQTGPILGRDKDEIESTITTAVEKGQLVDIKKRIIKLGTANQP
ncbi:MAG: hypothetical protein Q7S87_08680 [Agitococcus sp.]|nr:hypothetical protein [Agitococcus sp.]MDO9177645.1 hypothetical protein [Agitococcus sp.]